jgi:hypothetical protein
MHELLLIKFAALVYIVGALVTPRKGQSSVYLIQHVQVCNFATLSSRLDVTRALHTKKKTKTN